MVYQSKLQSRGDENILWVLFPGAKAEERMPTAAPIPASPGDGERHPPPALKAKRSPEKSRPPSPSPLRKKERWLGAPYLAELPRFYILLLPFVKFQMENSNISRGNQPNIGQRVKSKRMAEVSPPPLPPLLPLHIYIHTHFYIYIYVYIKWKREKKFLKEMGVGRERKGEPLVSLQTGRWRRKAENN